MKATEVIHKAIEDAIRAGDLLPGDPIDEAELISRHKVSRTPVREAMLQLVAQGLLTSQPRGGMVVAKMDVHQLLSMWELLGELEGICARLACERMTPAERSALAKAHEQAAAVAQADDLEAWMNINHAFHEALYQGSRNPYLRQQILHMRARTGAYRRHAFAAFGLIKTSHQQHEEVVKAILERDSAKAAAAMMQHLSPGQGTKGLTDFIVNLPKELLD
jgi:DNA-binding GntR family transcriptional regulator